MKLSKGIQFFAGSTQTTYDLTNLNLSAGNYAITVVAEAEGFTDSDASNSVNYSVQAQLAAPTIAMNADGKTLEITDVPNATSYDVYVDGTLKTNVERKYNITFGNVTGSHTNAYNGSYYIIKFDDGSYLNVSGNETLDVKYYDSNNNKIGETVYSDDMATRFGVSGVNSSTVEYYGKINMHYDSVDYGYFTVGDSGNLTPVVSSSNPHTTKTVSGELNIYGKYPD